MPNPSPALEALLRDACRRALSLGLSFTNQIRLYRSILALAREVRLRSGGAMQDAPAQTLAALLAAVCERASETGLDPELPLPDAILIHRLAAQLSGAARRATVVEPIERAYLEQNAMQREKPLGQPVRAQDPLQREEPIQPAAAEPAEQTIEPQHPMHRENAADDDRLSAWRRGHTADRDQRAHQKLRTVVEDRAYAKIKAMNQHDRAEREEAERTQAA